MSRYVARIVGRKGRQFKIEHGTIGEAAGWIVYERDLEPGIAWSYSGGAFNTISDAMTDIDKTTDTRHPWDDQEAEEEANRDAQQCCDGRDWTCGHYGT